MKYFFILFFVGIFQMGMGQRLQDYIKFDKLSHEDSLEIKRIDKLLPLSKRIMMQKCNNEVLRRYGCILEYKQLYIYNDEPILMEEGKYNVVRAIYASGAEGSHNFMTQIKTYIVNWAERKLISGSVYLSKDGISPSILKHDPYEVEEMMKR